MHLLISLTRGLMFESWVVRLKPTVFIKQLWHQDFIHRFKGNIIKHNNLPTWQYTYDFTHYKVFLVEFVDKFVSLFVKILRILNTWIVPCLVRYISYLYVFILITYARFLSTGSSSYLRFKLIALSIRTRTRNLTLSYIFDQSWNR